MTIEETSSQGKKEAPHRTVEKVKLLHEDRTRRQLYERNCILSVSVTAKFNQTAEAFYPIVMVSLSSLCKHPRSLCFAIPQHHWLTQACFEEVRDFGYGVGARNIESSSVPGVWRLQGEVFMKLETSRRRPMIGEEEKVKIEPSALEHCRLRRFPTEMISFVRTSGYSVTWSFLPNGLQP